MNPKNPTVRDIVAALRYYDKQIKDLQSSINWAGHEQQTLFQPVIDRIAKLHEERAEWQAALDEVRSRLRRPGR